MYTLFILLLGMYFGMKLTKMWFNASQPFTNISTFWEWVGSKIGVKDKT